MVSSGYSTWCIYGLFKGTFQCFYLLIILPTLPQKNKLAAITVPWTLRYFIKILHCMQSNSPHHTIPGSLLHCKQRREPQFFLSSSGLLLPLNFLPVRMQLQLHGEEVDHHHCLYQSRYKHQVKSSCTSKTQQKQRPKVKLLMLFKFHLWLGPCWTWFGARGIWHHQIIDDLFPFCSLGAHSHVHSSLFVGRF